MWRKVLLISAIMLASLFYLPQTSNEALTSSYAEPEVIRYETPKEWIDLGWYDAEGNELSQPYEPLNKGRLYHNAYHMESNSMSFEPDQLRNLIDRVLRDFADRAQMPMLYSKDAVELLMLTCAQETLLGTYIKQVKGPALGIFQMEPGAYNDLYSRFIVYKSEKLRNAYESFYADKSDWKSQMLGNIPYQIVLARMYYLRVPDALPDHTDVQAMAEYYKTHWNTYLGKATVEGAIKRYQRYAFV